MHCTTTPATTPTTLASWWTNDDQNYSRLPAPDTDAPKHLFNLTADPTEHHNVAAAFPEVVKRLQAKIDSYAEPANG